MTLHFHMSDLERELGNPTCDKGRGIHSSSGVRRVEVNADGTRVSGSVSGSRRTPYSQSIMLSLRAGRLRVTGYCTCPVAFNCKHVAAVLLAVLQQTATGRPSAADGAPAIPVNGPHTGHLQHRAAEGSASTRAEPAGEAEKSRLPRDEVVEPAAGRPAVAGEGDMSGGPAVSSEVAAWLEELGVAATAVSGTAAQADGAGRATGERLLVYVLDFESAGTAAEATIPVIRAVAARRGKGGALSDFKPYDPVNIQRSTGQRPRFVQAEDEAILSDLLWLQRSGRGHRDPGVRLGADLGSGHALDALLATGRLRYRTPDGPVLSAGPPVAARAQWVKADGGRQRLTFAPHDVKPEGRRRSDDGTTFRFDHVLVLSQPRYLDLARRAIGPIVSAFSPAMARAIAGAPAIGMAEAGLVREAMQRTLYSKRDAGNDPTDGEGSVVARERPAELPAAPLPGAVPLPDAPENVEVRRVVPRCRLELLQVEAGLKQTHLYYMLASRRPGFIALPIARLSFDYDGAIVANADPKPTLQRMEEGRLILLPRDQKAELEAAERLRRCGFKLLAQTPFSVSAGHQRDLYLQGRGNPAIYEVLRDADAADRFLEFGRIDVPILLAEGWEVLYADDYPFRLAEGEAQWWADAGEGTGIDWFSFELGIEFEGHRINLVQHLLRMLETLPPQTAALVRQADGESLAAHVQDMTFYHRLADGRMLPLPGARLLPMLRILLQLVGPRAERLTGETVKLHRAEATLLAEVADAHGRDVAWATSAERLVTLGRNLRRGRGLGVVTPPAAFKAMLRPYQGDGLAWLDFLRETGFGGALADDMGLGKTVQALAFLAREKAEGRLDRPALIVSPTSVLPNWQSEAERFAPDLKVLALRGLDRKESFGAISRHDLVLTTYPLLARDHGVLLQQEFHAAILDEAQAIKNPKAAVTALAHRIKARHRLALTGTPLENNLGEVWSLFEFLSPGLLGDESTFRRTFRTPIEKHGDREAQAFLSARLKPFLLRRTKAEVATELPPKTEIVERIQLEGPQCELYEAVRALMHDKVRDEIARKGLAKSHIVFLDALLKLRQICCDPRLLKMPAAAKVRGSAKLDRLMEMLPELVGEGRRILLFSQFTSMLALIEQELRASGIPYVQLTGQTADRAAPVKAFQSGKAPVFLLSLKAGGTGLNLTAADTVIHYDPWWNPAVENQATDRAYRIGQDKPVFVYKLIVEDGIEGAIEKLKSRKATLAEALFAGTSRTPLDLTEADVSALFAPLGGGVPSRGKRRVA